MRGKHGAIGHEGDQGRITPAGAGKTRNVAVKRQLIRDHPRRCGENLARAKGMVLDKGSPPQVRGKPRVSVARGAEPRITPAGAGKTSSVNEIDYGFQDHPRRCGENTIRQPLKYLVIGSPPQVRGKRIHHKTVLRQCKDHPRRCGENFAFAVKVVGVSGSPPQVRGKRLCSQTPTVGNRITPAGAGKTKKLQFSADGMEDHPRRCGENFTVCVLGVTG